MIMFNLVSLFNYLLTEHVELCFHKQNQKKKKGVLKLYCIPICKIVLLLLLLLSLLSLLTTYFSLVTKNTTKFLKMYKNKL